MKRAAKIREPSYVLLMVGIFVAAFGGSSLISGQRSVVTVTAFVIGVVLVVSMRIRRSRSGRWP